MLLINSSKHFESVSLFENIIENNPCPRELVPMYNNQKRKQFVVLVKDSNGDIQPAHLTNTGRLLDLIIPGNPCLCIPKNPGKTKIRLVGIPASQNKAVLIDPGEQSKSFMKAVEMGLIPWLKGWKIKRPEIQYEESRVDFQIESDSGKIGYIEVKSAGMLLERKVGSFPDCPTTRGQKHVRTMQKIAKKNHRSIILFLVQHPDAKLFSPNKDGDPEFVRLLKNAASQGVEVRAIKMYLQTDGNVVF